MKISNNNFLTNLQKPQKFPTNTKKSISNTLFLEKFNKISK